MRGRKAKPTKLKILEGDPSREGKEKLSMAPVGVVGMPECPPGLHPDVQEAWNRIGPMLMEMGVLEKVHGLPLRMLCRLAADYDVLERRLKCGTMAAKGFGALAKVEARLLKMLIEFGLTPAAVGKVKRVDGQEDPFTAFLNGEKKKA